MIDPKDGELRLSFLKRNDRYKDLFEEHRAYLESWHRHRGDKLGLDLYIEAKNNWHRAEEEFDRGKKSHTPEEERIYMAAQQAKEAAEAAWKAAEEASLAGPRFWIGARSLQYLGIEGFSQVPFSVKGNDGNPVLTAEEALAFIDPNKSIDGIERRKRNYVLSRIFGRDGIEVLPLEEKFDPSCDRVRRALRIDRPADTGRLHFALAILDEAIEADEAEHQGEEERGITILDEIRTAFSEAITELEKIPEPDRPRFRILPYERILLVDTSKGRGHLLKAFKAFLDNAVEDPRKQSRIRRQAEKQLEVFDIRQKKIPNEEIAKNLGIKVSTAEDRYLQALELTQGPQEVVDVLQKLCAICPDKGTEVCDSCPVQEKLLEKQKADRRAKRVRTGGTQPGQVNTEDESPGQVQAYIGDHFIGDSDTPCEDPHSWRPEVTAKPEWELPPERTDKKKVVLRKANPTK